VSEASAVLPHLDAWFADALTGSLWDRGDEMPTVMTLHPIGQVDPPQL
jgi:hypothetical protein